MKKIVNVFVITLVLVTASCKCPPGLVENLDSVTKIVAENDELRIKAGVNDPDGIKAGRNKSALENAQRLVEACK